MTIGSRSQLVKTKGALTEGLRKKASTLSQASDLFLAHSSADKGELLDAAIGVLSDAGATVYADFLDPEAKALDPSKFGTFFTGAVSNTERLVVILTIKTSSSKWVPWELGLAHGLHDLIHVAIWPLTDPNSVATAWAELGYMLQYPRFEWVRLDDTPQWAVRNPRNGKYWKLTTWLSLT